MLIVACRFVSRSTCLFACIHELPPTSALAAHVSSFIDSQMLIHCLYTCRCVHSAMWNSALSQSDVTFLKTNVASALSGQWSSCVFYYPMSTSGSTIVDAKSGTYTVSLVTGVGYTSNKVLFSISMITGGNTSTRHSITVIDPCDVNMR